MARYKIQLKLSQLRCPLSDVACRVRVVEHSPQREGRYHRDLMSLEVVAQLPGSDEYCVKQLVDLQIPCIGFMEDLADVVHRALDSLDPLGGVRRV
jgi:hypothetical protein